MLGETFGKQRGPVRGWSLGLALIHCGGSGSGTRFIRLVGLVGVPKGYLLNFRTPISNKNRPLWDGGAAGGSGLNGLQEANERVVVLHVHFSGGLISTTKNLFMKRENRNFLGNRVLNFLRFRDLQVVVDWSFLPAEEEIKKKKLKKKIVKRKITKNCK